MGVVTNVQPEGYVLLGKDRKHDGSLVGRCGAYGDAEEQM